jgi:hypothetical protein
MKSLLILLAACLPFTVQAYSAFAIAQPADIAHQGVADGTGFNYATPAAAQERAMSECNARAEHEHIQVQCRLMTNFDHKFLVVALDPVAGTPGYGWAISDSQEVATEQALDNCRRSDAGYTGCTVTSVDHDTTP